MNALSLLLLPLLIGSPNLTIQPEVRPSTPFNGYYDHVRGYGNELLASLRDTIVSTHKTYVNYNASGTDGMQYGIDYDPKNKDNLIDFYTHASFPKTWDSGNTYQREHVWCVSLSNGLWPRKDPGYGGADLHHIRPAFSDVNNARSNSPFGDLSGLPADEGTGTYTYKGTTYEYGKEYKDSWFEPIDEVKGDVARIVMYLFVHYNSPEALMKNSPTGSLKPIGTKGLPNDIDTGDLDITNIINTPNIKNTPRTSFDLLLKWNKLDPVDEYEIIRNEGAYKIQGNRNPFIDNPSFADMIWGGSTTPITHLTCENENINLTYGQALTNDMLRVFSHYEDGSYRYITDEITISNYDKFTIGQQTATITYKGTTLDIKVNNSNKGASQDGGFVQDEYSTGPFNEKLWENNNQTKPVAGVNWTFNATYSKQLKLSKDKSKGLSFGASTNPMQQIKISTPDFAHLDITRVDVEASGANGVEATLKVLVDDQVFDKPVHISNTSTVYSFNDNLNGETLTIQYNQSSSKALYLKSISVYTNGDKIVLFTALQQAKSYSRFFLEETKAFDKEDLTFEEVNTLISNGTWDKLKLEFDHMVNEAKDYFATSAIEPMRPAFQRYNKILDLYKANGLDNDFVGKREEPEIPPVEPDTSSSSSEQTSHSETTEIPQPEEPTSNKFDTKYVIIIVIVIAVIAITLITVLVLKHKSKSK